jgi:mono/diheme cytochrome c family protein
MCHPAGVGDILMAMMANWPKSLGVASLLLGAMTLLGTTAAVADSGTAAHAGAHPGANFALLGRCAKCHNSEDWAGGIAFDTLPTDDLAANAEVWEKVVRKLRGRLMPPPNVAQPDQPTIDAFVGLLENSLDRAPPTDPGNVSLHRLNRTEYGREIRRILGLDIDAATALPNDVSSDGFDNIAGVLRTSPTFLDEFITAARNVSRQAIGRASGKPSSRAYRAGAGLQLAHQEGLPLGTRGGMLVTHYFPADGEYNFNIRDFYFGGAGYVTKIDAPHTVILTIDDVRVFDGTVGGPADLQAVDVRQAEAADELQARFNHIRVRIKAGPHKVGVAFVQRSFAESDSPLQPIAELPEMERYPSIPGFDVSGPFNVTGVGDTESRRRIFICHPAAAAEEEPCARRILANLATEAFRRPATASDLEPLMRFYAVGRQVGDFNAGIESGLTAILSSTKFLFRAEPAPPGAAPGSVYRLGDLELASRLSFFIWSEGPDRQLLDLAAAGMLHDPQVLHAQIHRMLVDPRSGSLINNFAFQWLNIPKIDTIEPDPVLYPDFTPDVRAAFREEMRLFLNSVLRSDRSVLELLSSDRTFLNETLARQYGVPNILGDQFREVELTDPNRFGLLGKGAVLMATSYGNRTAPVLRGAWILENLTGTPPTSPPPGVGALKETEPGKEAETVRVRLERHRQNPSCNACHGVMDPMGFALENFDVVGAWRDQDRDAGSRIDSSGQLADGTHVSSPAQLRTALLARPDQFVQTLTEKLMTFALGRSVTYQDMPTVRGIVHRAGADHYRFEALVAGIVESDAFEWRELPPARPVDLKQAALTSQIQRSSP